jgi:hypothetical protein
MKLKFVMIPIFLLLFCAECKKNNSGKDGLSSSVIDLQKIWDEQRILINPDKGWYHHYYDNGTWGYKIKQDADADKFPGLHHFYIRIPWALLEPQEGLYDWSLIDDLEKKWVPKGMKFSFCITAKETNLQYATPKWVRDAGAKGQDVVRSENWIVNTWEPDYGDVIFLQKLENFHKAFAARYDGKDWVTEIVTGSVGTWGEGHSSFSSEKIYPVEVFKKHLDLYKRAYKKSQLVTGDDWIKWNRNSSETEELKIYAGQLGYSYRDDSILVDYWLKNLPANQASVAAPFLFESVYKKYPTTLECQHYQLVKQDGNWTVPNGATKGADNLKKAIEITHASYVGFHGYLDEWLNENPQITGTLLNKMGYWYFPKLLDMPGGLKIGVSNSISVTWLNKGVAPAYNKYNLYIRFVSTANASVVYEQPVAESDNTKWSNDAETKETYSVALPANLVKGKYLLQISLKKEIPNKPARVIELGLALSKRSNDGYYTVSEVTVE